MKLAPRIARTRPLHRKARRRRARPALIGACFLVLAGAASAFAYFAVTAIQNGTGAVAAADAIPAGPVPAADVTGQSVSVAWSAITTVAGQPVQGYTLARYAAPVGGAPVAATGSCGGTLTTTSCTESAVSAGNWYYAVTAHIDAWSGAESPRSPVATVMRAPEITSANSESFTVGTAASFTVQSSGFPAASLDDAAAILPSGVTFTDNRDGTATIAGTPAMGSAGTYLFTITASNGAGSATQPFTLDVAAAAAPLRISTGSLPDGQVGMPYDATLEASGGTGARAWSVSSGTLPAGLTLNAGTGDLSGIPTGPGTATMVFLVTDASQATATSSPLDLTVSAGAGLLQVTTSGLPTAEKAANYSTTLAATGAAPGPVTWSVSSGTLPAGLSLSPGSGTIAGEPSGGATTATGLVFQVEDSSRVTATSAPLTLTVVPAVKVTTATLPDAEIHLPYSATLAAGGGAGPDTWSLTAGSLPSGLSFDPATGKVSGTPTVTGLFPGLKFTAADAAGGTAVSANLSITVASALTATTTALPGAEAGVSYSATLASSGGTGGTTWSLAAGSLPAGLTLHGPTGVISGKLTRAAVTAANLVFTVADSAGGAASSAPLTITVLPPVAVTTSTLPAGVVGVSYSATLVATGGTGSFTWASTGAGSLPAGLSLDATTGAISGTPTGMSTIGGLRFTATDEKGGSGGSAALTLVVRQPLEVTSASLPDAELGVGYAGQLSAAGGSGSYTWSLLSGSLPAGLSLKSNGSFSGKPTVSNTAVSAQFQVKDSTGAMAASPTLGISVLAPLSVTTSSLPGGTVGQPYSAGLTATGGSGEDVWSVSGQLPAGLTLDPSGTIAGSPSLAGNTSVHLKVADAAGAAATAVLTLSVTPG